MNKSGFKDANASFSYFKGLNIELLKNKNFIIILGIIMMIFSLMNQEYAFWFISFYVMFVCIFVYNKDNQDKNNKGNDYILYDELISSLQTMKTPVLFLNQKEMIIFFNQSFQQCIKEDVLENKKYMEVFEDELLELIKQSFLLKKDFVHIIFIFDKYYKVIGKSLCDKDVFQGMFLLFVDVSDLKEKQKLQNQFYKEVVDEIDLSLSKINNLVQNFKKEVYDDNAFNELLLESQHIKRTIETVVENGDEKIELLYTEIDIEKLMNESMLLFRDMAKQKQLVFVYQNSIQQMVILDYSSIQIIVHHLLGNAVAFCETGVITIKTFIENKQLHIVVQDEGIGIAKDHLPFIFDRFYQVENKQDRVTYTGLGLTIVKKMVELNQGTIEVASRQGIGTVFIVKIPFYDSMISQNVDIIKT